MRALLDVNVLVALLDPQNLKHVGAYDWLAENSESGWASCPLTENACLRLLTNPRYRSGALSPELVEKNLRKTKESSNHEFWPDDLSITDATIFDWTRLQGHQQVTDIYLLALAVARRGRLVTFDKSIFAGAVVGNASHHLVTL